MPIGFIDSKKYGKRNVIISVCSVSIKKDVCLIRRFFPLIPGLQMHAR